MPEISDVTLRYFIMTVAATPVHLIATIYRTRMRYERFMARRLYRKSLRLLHREWTLHDRRANKLRVMADSCRKSRKLVHEIDDIMADFEKDYQNTLHDLRPV